MKIKAILEQKPTVSFEVFPPKQWDKIEGTKAVVKEMVKSHPAFMSVTYGAAGTTSGFTTEIAREILDDGVTPLAHLTCLTSTRDKIHQVVAELQENGIENILALRGDIPRDFQFPAEQYFEHAYQLVNEIRTLGDFALAAPAIRRCTRRAKPGGRSGALKAKGGLRRGLPDHPNVL